MISRRSQMVTESPYAYSDVSKTVAPSDCNSTFTFSLGVENVRSGSSEEKTIFAKEVMSVILSLFCSKLHQFRLTQKDTKGTPFRMPYTLSPFVFGSEPVQKHLINRDPLSRKSFFGYIIGGALCPRFYFLCVFCAIEIECYGLPYRCAWLSHIGGDGFRGVPYVHYRLLPPMRWLRLWALRLR